MNDNDDPGASAVVLHSSLTDANMVQESGNIVIMAKSAKTGTDLHDTVLDVRARLNAWHH